MENMEKLQRKKKLQGKYKTQCVKTTYCVKAYNSLGPYSLYFKLQNQLLRHDGCHIHMNTYFTYSSLAPPIGPTIVQPCPFVYQPHPLTQSSVPADRVQQSCGKERQTSVVFAVFQLIHLTVSVSIVCSVLIFALIAF